MAKPNHPLSGQIISVGQCPSCGKNVSNKVNKNGVVYFFCSWPDNDTGERCNHTTKYPRRIGNKMIEAHQTKKDTPHGSPENTSEETDGAADRSERDRPATNFLGQS